MIYGILFIIDFRHFIFIGNFDIRTEIEVQNMDESTFTSLKLIWKKIFSKILNVREKMIELQYQKMLGLRYNKRIGRILIDIKSITAVKKDFVYNTLKSPDFIAAVTREKDSLNSQYPQLKVIEVPKQELKPVVKPVSGKLEE